MRKEKIQNGNPTVNVASLLPTPTKINGERERECVCRGVQNRTEIEKPNRIIQFRSVFGQPNERFWAVRLEKWQQKLRSVVYRFIAI